MPRLNHCLLLFVLVGCGISPEERPYPQQGKTPPSKLGGNTLENPVKSGNLDPKDKAQFQATPAGCDTAVDVPESSLIHGVSIAIPSGALLSAETLTFSGIRHAAGIVAGTPLGVVYTLAGNGQDAFEKPVSIRIPLPPEHQEDLVLAYQIDENGKLHLMNAITEGDGTKSVVVSSWKACRFTLVVVDSL